MADFDERKAYAKQEDVYFNDGREIEVLHFVYSKANIDEIRGSPEKVLAAIDEYARKHKYLMNVGEDKGKTVCDIIAETKPETMVELGGYVGYSTILFANAMRAAGGKHYYSLEDNPEFAAVIMALVDLAGLRDIVRVMVGKADDSIRRLASSKAIDHIGLLFLDHVKPLYIADLKLCEQLGFIRPGSVLAADNMIKPGNPPYEEYVRSTVPEKRARLKDQKNDADRPDRGLDGNPNLVYESKRINGPEPTGVPDAVEITRCTREEKQD